MTTFTNTRSETMPRPIGEMRKVQGAHSRSGLGRARSRAPADPVDCPYLEDVDRAVDQAGDRMSGLGGTHGYPASSPVNRGLSSNGTGFRAKRRPLAGVGPPQARRSGL